MKKVYDANGAIVGRLGTFVAKDLLKGYEVDVINAEKALISGSQADIIGKRKHLRGMGGAGLKGPKHSKMTDRMLKRMIRGMLPWDRTKGMEAWKRLKCYNSNLSNKEEFKNAIKLNHEKPYKYMTLEEISKLL